MKKTVRKEFVFPTESRAILEASVEFGDDFDIIRKEHVEIGGLLGFFTKPGIRIIVQSPKSENVRGRLKEKNRKSEVERQTRQNETVTEKIPDLKDKHDKELQNMKDFLNSMKMKKTQNIYDQNPEDTELLKKIFSNPVINPHAKKNNYINLNNVIVPNVENNNSNKSIERLTQEIGKIRKTLEVIRKADNSRKKETENKSPLYSKYYELLEKQDFPCSLLEKVMEKHEKYLNRIEMENEELYLKKLKEFIIDHIYTRAGITVDDRKKITLVGPTGVGKTTTVAKLGYYFKYEQNKNVKIISTDHYKYGGIKQLEDICNEMQIDFAPVYDKESYRKELDDDKYDIILIDTAGKNYRDTASVIEIKEYIEKDSDIEKYLVLSAESKYKDLLRINENFSDVCLKGVIFTKCDSTQYYGTMLGFLIKSKNSFVYTTTGKKIDGDIQEAIPYKIIDGLFND